MCVIDSFCRLVAELSGIKCPPEQELYSQSQRVEWLGREDKRVIIHFTPYHGSWLNFVEIWFGIMGGKVLRESFGSPNELKEALEVFVGDWDAILAHPFNWSYNGTGLHEKVVKRFTKMLHGAAAQMELRTLTKQMRLLSNLLKGYGSEVSKESWNQLAATLSVQSETLAEIIRREEGSVRKHKARQALADLTAALQEYFTPTQK